MTRTALIAGVAGSVLAFAASAQVSVNSTNRFVRVAAEGGVLTDGPRTTSGPTTGAWVFDDEAAAVEGGNGGTSQGIQNSGIAGGLLSGVLDSRADAFGDGSDFASGYGQSHFELDFSVTGPASYILAGFVNAFGDINGEVSEAYIELVDLSDNSIVWSIFVDDGFQAVNQMGVLAAGNYRLEADSLSIVDRIFENGFGDANATVEFTMTVVPAPASAAMLALGAGGCFIRRRR
jgi:hypothetical protein